MNKFQERIETTAQKILGAISPISKELGLDDIENRTQVDILVLVHALRQVQDFYLDEISDGQFKKKQEDRYDKEPIYTSLPTEEFMKEQDRVFFRKDGDKFIIYYDEGEGPGDDVWAVFKELPEEECGSDDDPDYQFDTYEALWDWAQGKDSLPEQEICTEP